MTHVTTDWSMPPRRRSSKFFTRLFGAHQTRKPTAHGVEGLNAHMLNDIGLGGSGVHVTLNNHRRWI